MTVEYEIFKHLRYSTDMEPPDYQLFPKLKKELSGRHTDSDDDIIATFVSFVEVKDVDFYKEGIHIR